MFLHFCVSSVSTERLNDCVDAASCDGFCLVSWNVLADAPKRVAASCLHQRVGSMRT
jgi:hypothetical protein